MEIKCLEIGPIPTNAFLLWNNDSKEAILIDAPHDAWTTVEPILKQHNLSLKALLITHGHWDHIGEAKNVKDQANVPLYAHPDDQDWIEDPSEMNDFIPPEFRFPGASVNHLINDQDSLDFIGETIKILHVPGHCPGNVVFYFPNTNTAFVGDAIFAGSIGRTDLPRADHDTLISKIKEHILTLPDNTTLYSGHGPKTTVAREKASNPFVGAHA